MKAIKFTPERVKSLIVELYAGARSAHRDTIAAKVLQIHLERGGEEPKMNRSLKRFVGPLLGELQREGRARFHAPKYWKGENASDSRWEILG